MLAASLTRLADIVVDHASMALDRGKVMITTVAERNSRPQRPLSPSDQPAKPAAGAPSLSSSHNTILVIDDESGIRMITERILTMLGYQVVLARNGKEGIAQFQRHSSELCGVLLDLTMPDLDGEATFYVIHGINPDVPIIVMSGHGEHEINRRFGKEGLAGFLSKPFMIEELRAKLAQFQPPA
jgi:CheY-like chemotaxis protein